MLDASWKLQVLLMLVPFYFTQMETNIFQPGLEIQQKGLVCSIETFERFHAVFNYVKKNGYILANPENAYQKSDSLLDFLTTFFSDIHKLAENKHTFLRGFPQHGAGYFSNKQW